MARIMITMSKEEKEALILLSQKELRDPRSQAALIIRQHLQDIGLINNPLPVLPVEQREEKEDKAILQTSYLMADQQEKRAFV